MNEIALHIQNGTLDSYTGRDEILTIPEGVHTIGKDALKGCVSLKKVILPESLRRIRSGAFKGCRKLEEVEIPEGVCEIGAYAFHRCHALKKIVLPPAIETLGDCVFLYCNSLEEACIPGVRRLGNQVFVNDIHLKKITLSDELEEDCLCDVFTSCGLLTDFTLVSGKHFVIPNAVEAVTGTMPLPSLIQKIAIDILRMMELDGRTMIQLLTNLKHVEIPEGVEILGKNSFFDRSSLLSIKLPKSLKEIESHAFRNCIRLETVIFEGEDLLIHEDAFKSCTSLKYILTPDGVRHEWKGIACSVGEDVPKLVKTIHKQILGNFLIRGTILLKYLGAESRVTVPDGITVIAERAFDGNKTIDRVILPESLLEIGAYAFFNCPLLQTISFPESLQRIGEAAFKDCVKLLRITLPRTFTRLEESVFRYCHALKEIDLGEELIEIEAYAFEECYSLERISFPESLVSIEWMAFSCCSALKEIKLSLNVKNVGSESFSESGVEKVHISADCQNYGYGIFSDCTRLKKLVLAEGVVHIPDELAYGCTALEQVTLPDSLTSVGTNVWEGTPFLEKWIQEGQKGEIFWDGSNLKGEVWLPEKVRILAGGAFDNNHGLTAIHLSENITWIGLRAFCGCKRLSRVYWDSPVDRLEYSVFNCCDELMSVEDSQGRPVAWKSIGGNAFRNCHRLQEICLQQAESIGQDAFYGCTGLNLTVPSDNLRWIGKGVFEDTTLIKNDGNGLVVLGNIVISATGCSGEITLSDGIIGIAPLAFVGKGNNITKVDLPESLSWIGEKAFWLCSSLKEIHFPKNPCEIDAGSFEKCTSLSEINLRASRLGASAFANCTALVNAVISDANILSEHLFEGCASLQTCICENAEQIQAHCFSGCTSLKDYDLSRIYKIEAFAFKGCDNLKSVKFANGATLMPHAFEGCNNLKSVEFADGATLMPYAFEGCEHLEEIRLGKGQGRLCLQERTFFGCTFLRWVTLQGKRWELCTYKDVLSDHIPEIVRLIFHSALSCFEIGREANLYGYQGTGRSIKIPHGIRRIEAEIFRDVVTLEEIIIPESVEYIGARAFYGTAWMDRQRLASPFVTVNHMLLDASCCTGEVVVPEDIKMVCECAFADGTEIERIRFLSERTQVEESAFRNCTYLREIILPDHTSVQITGIADREKTLPALAMQAVMDSMNCFKTDKDHVLVECTGNISKLRIPEGITAIGESAFQYGNLLTEVTFPRSIITIGNRAFSGCKQLRVVEQAQNVEEIGMMAFLNCKALERIECSEKLRRLGARAFENCISLQEILIPEGVEEIPEKAFYRCRSLKRIDLPSSIKRIGKEAFAFCGKRVRIYIPENAVQNIVIEEGAFIECRKTVLKQIKRKKKELEKSSDKELSK